MKPHAAFAVLFAILCSCSTSGDYFNKPVSELRSVTLATDPAKSVEVMKVMFFYDNNLEPTYGIELSIGKYVLVAEDQEYLYFSAPYSLAYQRYQNYEVLRHELFKGGLALARSSSAPVRAAIYANSDTIDQKVIVWRLDPSFFGQLGKRWKKSF
jgi:hypothetical protein